MTFLLATHRGDEVYLSQDSACTLTTRDGTSRLWSRRGGKICAMSAGRFAFGLSGNDITCHAISMRLKWGLLRGHRTPFDSLENNITGIWERLPAKQKTPTNFVAVGWSHRRGRVAAISSYGDDAAPMTVEETQEGHIECQDIVPGYAECTELASMKGMTYDIVQFHRLAGINAARQSADGLLAGSAIAGTLTTVRVTEAAVETVQRFSLDDHLAEHPHQPPIPPSDPEFSYLVGLQSDRLPYAAQPGMTVDAIHGFAVPRG